MRRHNRRRRVMNPHLEDEEREALYHKSHKLQDCIGGDGVLEYVFDQMSVKDANRYLDNIIRERDIEENYNVWFGLDDDDD